MAPVRRDVMGGREGGREGRDGIEAMRKDFLVSSTCAKQEY